MYNKIDFILEPCSFVKGESVVQLIRPNNRYQETVKSFLTLPAQVDLSNCGLIYDGEDVYEACDYSIYCCLNKVYYKTDGLMSTDRVYRRMAKFNSRGWERSRK